MSMPRIPLVVILLSALCIGCSQKRAESDEEAPSNVSAVVAVRSAPIIKGSIEVAVVATGKIDALRKVKIVSPLAGRIQSLNVVEGSPVKSGDVVAVIQSKEAHAAIAGAEALLQSARTPEEKAEARRALSLAQATQNTVRVFARCNGVVGSRSVNTGEFVSESAELLTVIDLSTLDFVADVPLADLGSIRRGQACLVSFPSWPGEHWNARVDAIYPQADPQSQTAKVRLRFAGGPAARLRTDMAGVARIIVGRRLNAFLVPKTALLRNDETGTQTIVSITADSLARILPVQLGATTDSTAEISGEGIREGMPVIVEGHYALPDSTRVQVESAARPAEGRESR
jgi:membrane fusion protein, multidrug efflux system